MAGKFIAAVAASSVTMMLVGFVLYGVVFVSLFQEGANQLPGVMRESPQISWIVLGQIGFAVLVTLVVSWRDAVSFTGGAITGMLFGFLMAVGFDFAQFGTSNLWSLRATLVDPFLTATLVGSGGAVSGAILGRRSTHEQAH